MAEALADGEAIRPSDFYDTQTRYDQAQRSLGSLRKRAEEGGVIVSAGPWGPRGGVRWQYNAAATEALSTAEPERLKELILTSYPERKTDRHRDTLRAALSNPHVPAEFLLSLDLGDDGDADLRSIRIQNPVIPIEVVEATPVPHLTEDAKFHLGIVERLARDPDSTTDHLLRTAYERDDTFYAALADPLISEKRREDPLWATLTRRGEAGDLRAVLGLKLLESGVFRLTTDKEFFEALDATCGVEHRPWQESQNRRTDVKEVSCRHRRMSCSER